MNNQADPKNNSNRLGLSLVSGGADPTTLNSMSSISLINVTHNDNSAENTTRGGGGEINNSTSLVDGGQYEKQQQASGTAKATRNV